MNQIIEKGIDNGIKSIPGALLGQKIKKSEWIDMFIKAGRMIADYESGISDEQNDIRHILFGKENMRELACFLFNTSPFDFDNNLNKCLDDIINKSNLNVDNRKACKTHFLEMIKVSMRECFGEIHLSGIIQETYDMVKVCGENMVTKEDINRLMDSLSAPNINNYYQQDDYVHKDFNYKQSKNIKLKIKWKLSHSKRMVNKCDVEEIKQLTTTWREERENYPGWFVVPYNISKELEWKTTCFFGNALDKMNITDRMLFIYEYVWRMETGMNSYSFSIQQQVYSSWLKYYDYMKTDNFTSYVSQWFYVGRALLRDFCEDCNILEWNKVYDIMTQYSNHEVIENGKLILEVEKIKLSYSLYNMKDIRDNLRRLSIPDKCIELRIFRIGMRMECGEADSAKNETESLLRYIEECIEKIGGDYGDSKRDSIQEYVKLKSYYGAILNIYLYIVEGMAVFRNEYEQKLGIMEEISGKIDEYRDYFDMPGYLHSVNEGLLKRQAGICFQNEPFELNRELHKAVYANSGFQPEYYLYRMVARLNMPVKFDRVNYFGDIEKVWLSALYDSFPMTALNMLVKSAKADNAKCILTRKRIASFPKELISDSIRYLIKLLKNNIEEFVEKHVEIDDDVCERLKCNVPEILVRYLTKCSEDIQKEVIRVVIKMMETPDIVMNDRMDAFIINIMRTVSDKVKAELLDDMLEMDIVEHMVNRGCGQPADIFDYCFVHEDSKKYCIRTERTECAIHMLLNNNPDDDIYTWRTKNVRLRVLYIVELLTEEEISLYIDRLWSRLDDKTMLPDLPNWYVWLFFKLVKKDETLPIVSLKSNIINKGMVNTYGNETDGVSITMGEISYIEQISMMAKQLDKDFFTLDECERIFADAIDYWDIIKGRIKPDASCIIDRIHDEYKRRIYALLSMLENVYCSITVKLNDSMVDRVSDFLVDLERYGIYSDVIGVQFFTGDKLQKVIGRVQRAMYSGDERKSIDAMMAAYSYISRYPENENAKSLFECMVCVLRTRKEPCLVSCLVLIHNLVYENSCVIEGKLEDLDASLYELYNATSYGIDDDELTTKHKVLVRSSSARLAYQLNNKYNDYSGEGITAWLSIKSGDDFAEVVNEIDR